jgi:hypothetical protein
MQRFTISIIFGLVLGLSPVTALELYGQTSVSSSKHPIYINHVYNFRVTVPPGVTYTRTLPPNPDHGIGIEMHDQTKLWVDASYTESSSIEEEISKESADCKVEQQQSISLGSMPAVQVNFSCTASSNEKAYEEKLVLLVHRSEHRSPVCYEIGMRATDGMISARADNLFNKLIVTFSFLNKSM